MTPSEVKTVWSSIEQQLAGVGEMDRVVEQAVEELLNLVERLIRLLIQQVQISALVCS